MIKNYLLIASILLNTINAFSQHISVSVPYAITCSAGEPLNLYATTSGVMNETTSYTVSAISPTSPFATNSGSAINLTSDDNWSQIFNLKAASQTEPFNFSFYGNTYDKCLLNTNGAISFSIAGQTTGGVYSPFGVAGYQVRGSIPFNPGVTHGPYLNAINMFQDLNIGVGTPNVNYYVAGTYPNRAFVFNLNNVSNFSCTAVVQNSQIVLYEGSNIIDVYVRNRSNDCSWDGAKAVLGIQNNDGTQGIAPPNRNTGPWEVLASAPEAWRFTPSGNPITPIYEWKNSAGEVVGTGQNIVVYPVNTENYTVTVTYNVNGVSYVYTDGGIFEVFNELSQTQEGYDLLTCEETAQTAAYDLTVNTPVILNGLDTSRFEVAYFTTLSDAQNTTNPIVNPLNFTTTGEQTIYARVSDMFSICHRIKSFNIGVSQIPAAPTGNSMQTYTDGETLADLEVTGQNIQWYGSATGNDLLSDSTVLVNGTTYYASQTNSFGCESRTAAPSRLAVTVQSVLSNEDWNNAFFKAYPNPVKEVLILSYSSKISSVEVFNMLGQNVLTKNSNTTNTQIDMSQLNTGAYLVKVTSEGVSKTIKVVKQ